VSPLRDKLFTVAVRVRSGHIIVTTLGRYDGITRSQPIGREIVVGISEAGAGLAGAGAFRLPS